MTKEELTNKLEALGLTNYQSQAYVAAVQAGQATPNDLVDASDVPQGRIYDVLYDLEEMGLVEIRSRGRSKEVIAPSPETVLNDLKRRRIDELSSTVESLSATLQQEHGRSETEGDDYVTMASREETALRHIGRAIDAADNWLTVALGEPIYRQLREPLLQAAERGVTVHLLISDAQSELDTTYPDAFSVRHRETVDTIVAADRAYGIFSSRHPRRDQQPYLITQEPNLVLLLQDYIQTIWGASRRIQSNNRFPKRYLDPRRAIADLGETLRTERVTARVTGYRTDTHDRGTWDGDVRDYRIESDVEVDYALAPPIIASLTLATDDGQVTVGGWRATMEDIAATGLELRRE